MSAPTFSILVTFAVPQEAAGFRRAYRRCPNVNTVVTGMGKAGVNRTLERLDRLENPRVMITAGFAGALSSNLRLGDVGYDRDTEFGEKSVFQALGALPVKFATSDHVLVDAPSKKRFGLNSGGEAVDMESSYLRQWASERGIPSATVRAISDEADEDLPLNFNEFVTGSGGFNYPKLMWRLAARPVLIPKLIMFSKRTNYAGERLSHVLNGLVAHWINRA